MTAPRLAVLDALVHHPHADAATVLDQACRTLGGLSVQTAYNVLDALAARELVRRIQPAGSPARFEVRVGDNHHHVVCRACGATADVDCAVGAAPCLEPSQTHGFLLDEAEVTYWGLCPACRRRADHHDREGRAR